MHWYIFCSSWNYNGVFLKQTKFESFIESFINISSGFFLSLGIWYFIVVPFWEIKLPFSQNIIITLIFTISSVIRSYIWRRIFNTGFLRLGQDQ